jgi:hypothetical protein
MMVAAHEGGAWVDKSFRSLARDPWNKLKVYFCLRMIEVEHESDHRARLLVGLADARKRMDPVLALILCEAALKLAPQDTALLQQVRSLLSTMSSGSTQVGRPDEPAVESRVAGGPDTRTSAVSEEGHRRAGRAERRRAEDKRQREDEERRRREDEERRRREDEERRRREDEERRRREDEERKRREKEASIRAEIRNLGYAAYLRKQLVAQGVEASVLSTLEGFQSNPRGMVQFLELVRLKRALAEPAWFECFRLLEEAMVLADPKDPALEALRALALSS